MKTSEVKKIITSAIGKEEEAFTFYTAASGKVKDKWTKDLYAELAGEEKKHKEFLEGFLAKPVAEMKFDAADYKVTDALPTPKLTPDLKPLDGLLIAIRNELDAMQTYNKLAKSASSIDAQLLFAQLANMEKSHKQRLEDIYTNMAWPESW